MDKLVLGLLAVVVIGALWVYARIVFNLGMTAEDRAKFAGSRALLEPLGFEFPVSKTKVYDLSKIYSAP
jgi:hypothetical protein